MSAPKNLVLALHFPELVIYEDDWCFVLNKPTGLHSVSLPNDTKDTLARRLGTRFPSLLEVSEKPEDVGLVQRLDFETSGIILGAKDRGTWNRLHISLLEGKVDKSYLVLLDGGLTKPALVNSYIGNPNRRAKKVRVFTRQPRSSDRALPASSSFMPIEFFSELRATLAKVEAHTARRHQVRAHAAHLGHPLIGDSLYGSKRNLEPLANGALPAFILHAETLSFFHPELRKQIVVEAPRPAYLIEVLKKYQALQGSNI